jgi:hypothetical protein
VVRVGKRDHRHPPLRCGNLLVVLPQLREMLLAIESTEVAEEDQNGWAPKQSLRVEDFAVNRHEVEVKIDRHRTMMRPPPYPYVIGITEERRSQALWRCQVRAEDEAVALGLSRSRTAMLTHR